MHDITGTVAVVPLQYWAMMIESIYMSQERIILGCLPQLPGFHLAKLAKGGSRGRYHN